MNVINHTHYELSPTPLHSVLVFSEFYGNCLSKHVFESEDEAQACAARINRNTLDQWDVDRVFAVVVS